MRCLKSVGKHGVLGLCIIIGITVCSNTRGISRAETEHDATAPAREAMPIGCSRGHDVKLGDTCVWTIEGDEVEMRVATDGCVHVSLGTHGQRDPGPGPRLCPGGPDYSKQGLSEGDVGDTVVASTLDAPMCGMLSISDLSLVFNGADIHIGPGLDLNQLVARWNETHWFVQETPNQDWIDPRRVVEVPATQDSVWDRMTSVGIKGTSP